MEILGYHDFRVKIRNLELGVVVSKFQFVLFSNMLDGGGIYLGGGNSNKFLFSSLFGEMIIFSIILFRWVGSTTN